MTRNCLLLLVAFSTIAIVDPSRAADPGPNTTLSIAAAANLVYAIDALNVEFSKIDPGIAVTSTTGASGSIVAQIVHGAPYDVFLSADTSFAQALIKEGKPTKRAYPYSPSAASFCGPHERGSTSLILLLRSGVRHFKSWQ